MAGCDGWITIKIFELVFATFCMIYKRVTDDEANKLFYFLQKFSREWPLLNNITWEENGAIFTDITYGGYIIIIIGLIIGQCSGELQKCRKTENFFLILGALLFIAAGSLELAALESVEERLVDNAAILGVFSLLTGFLFIIDLIFASKRRKKERLRMIDRYMQSKPTQTEESKPSELIKSNYLNGNIQNGKAHLITDFQNGSHIPRNAVKLLPSSPPLSDNGATPATNGNEFTNKIVGLAEPPVISGTEIKTHEGKVKSTESFLRSEKGYYLKFRQPSQQDVSNNNFFVPAGYVLVPAEQLQEKTKPKSDSGIGDSPTPPGYAKIIPDSKGKPGYVIIPIDQKESSKKMRSPVVSKSLKSFPEFYYIEKQDGKSSTPNLYRSISAGNSSDASDMEESKFEGDFHREAKPRFKKISLEYPETDSRGRKYILQSEDSSDEQRLSYPSEALYFRPESRHSSRSLRGSKEWRHHAKGRVNEGYSVDTLNDSSIPSRKSSPYRSKPSSPEKSKSILRYDYGRSRRRENELHFLKDGRYDSLDSRKIAEDLRNLREITKSDLDLSENLEKGRLKNEPKEGRKLDESDEEKNRRVSEREEQYFGIKDLKQSHKDSLETAPKTKLLETQKIRKGVKEVNEKLKHLKHESRAAREAQEFRDLIDERFHFLHEEEKERKHKEMTSALRDSPEKSGIPEVHSALSLSGDSKPLKPQKSDSDDVNSSQSTDEIIKLRVETPGSASYKSEALFWLGSDREYQNKSNTPTSPGSPGYVLYTAQNWPDSHSPEDRFQFSAKEAQQLTLGTPPKTPVLERIKPDTINVEEKKNSQKLRLLEFEEVPESSAKSPISRKELLVKKVDFPKQPVVVIKKPAVVQGSTSTWKRWLYPKPKLQHMKSAPN